MTETLQHMSRPLHGRRDINHRPPPPPLGPPMTCQPTDALYRDRSPNQ